MNTNNIHPTIESVHLIAWNAPIEFAPDVLRISTSTKVCVFRLALPKNTQVLLSSMMAIVIWKIFVLGKTLSARSTIVLFKMAAAANVHWLSLLHSYDRGGEMSQPLCALWHVLSSMLKLKIFHALHVPTSVWDVLRTWPAFSVLMVTQLIMPIYWLQAT